MTSEFKKGFLKAMDDCRPYVLSAAGGIITFQIIDWIF